MKKRIYIAGPMRGKPRFNFDAFFAAEDDLLVKGWEVLNPARMDIEVGFNPDTDTPEGEFLDAAMRRDVEAILSADAIAMLPGWENSTGAKAEYHLAKWRHIPIYFYPGMKEHEGVLEEAVRITSGDRRRDYDHATPNHERIASGWNWYLSSRRDPQSPVTALDAAHMMILLKLARSCHTPKRDNYVDIAGYSRCAAQISDFEP